MKKQNIILLFYIFCTNTHITLPKPPPIHGIAQRGAVLQADPENGDYDQQAPQAPRRHRRRGSEWSGCVKKEKQKDLPNICTPGCCMFTCSICLCPLSWQAGIEAYDRTEKFMDDHHLTKSRSILPLWGGFMGLAGTTACITTISCLLGFYIDKQCNALLDAYDPLPEIQDDE